MAPVPRQKKRTSGHSAEVLRGSRAGRPLHQRDVRRGPHMDGAPAPPQLAHRDPDVRVVLQRGVERRVDDVALDSGGDRLVRVTSFVDHLITMPRLASAAVS